MQSTNKFHIVSRTYRALTLAVCSKARLCHSERIVQGCGSGLRLTGSASNRTPFDISYKDLLNSLKKSK